MSSSRKHSVLQTMSSWRIRLLPKSIALHVTIWYAISTFVLIAAASGILYWALVRSLDQEDARVLADSLGNLRLIMQSSSSGSLLRLPQTQQETGIVQPEIYLRILDSAGRVLVERPGMSNALAAPGAADLAAIEAGTSHEVISRTGKPLVVTIERITDEAPGGAPLFVQVALDRSRDEDLLAGYREWLWVVLAFALGICALSGYAVAKRSLRPIGAIEQATHRIDATTLGQRIAVQSLPVELQALAETFNRMLDRLEASFARISQFSDDAAHELRTPVNNLRSEIEVTLGKTRTAEAYRDVLNSCLEECIRISRIIECLLFLARSESAGAPLQLETANVNDELNTIREFYEPAATEAGVDLSVAAPKDTMVMLDGTLFRQAVSNLVSNALAHTATGGTVELRATCEGSRALIRVIDSGCGISQKHLPHVFERFYRIDGARADSATHAGLGLAIVKSIVARHGGHIDIESLQGVGTQVTIALPSGRH